MDSSPEEHKYQNANRSVKAGGYNLPLRIREGMNIFSAAIPAHTSNELLQIILGQRMCEQCVVMLKVAGR